MVVAVLGAGVLHALWNAIAKGLGDVRDSFALLNLGVVAVCGVLLPFVGFPNRSAYVYLAMAVVVHQIYELVLMAAYRHADFSQSYPIARGIAPLLVSCGGVIFANETVGVRNITGVLVVTTGVVLLSRRPSQSHVSSRGIWWAIATGVAIAIYTVIDGCGVRTAGSSLRYAVTLFFLQSLMWTMAVSVRRGWSWRPTRVRIAVGAAGGVISMLGYFTVLWAQTRTTLGTVSALRETGVFWAAVFGVVLFREGTVRRLLPPAVLVVAGVTLLSL